MNGNLSPLPHGLGVAVASATGLRGLHLLHGLNYLNYLICGVDARIDPA
jgi:hypothetical protein